MRRVNVVGMSSTGKTTLGRMLASRLGVTHIELDALFWGAHWTPVPEDEFRQRVGAALAADGWVADGGYQVARDIIWNRADAVVWLDYSLPVILRRLARRTIGRIRSGEECWPGTDNRETLGTVFRRDGLLWYVLRHHRGKRRRMAARLATRPDLVCVRLRSPHATARWLASVR